MPVSTPNGYLDFTNATPRATKIIATSNVGIGFNNPIYALDVAGTANVAGMIVNNDLTLTGGLTANTLTINSMSMSTTSNFQQVTNVGNVTTNTVEFTNPTTGFAVSSNASVGGELSVSGNVEVGTANLFVDTTTGNVGIGTGSPEEKLDVWGNTYVENNSIFMSGYNEGPSNNTEYSQYIGKRYNGRILAGMEIENVRTNSAGTAITPTGEYSQKLHFRAHDHGLYGGLVSDRTMTLVGGNVGIGTVSPSAKLHVNGTMRADGSVVQLQNRTFNLSFSSTSTTFTDTGAYVDITPKFSNSKFFVMFDGLAFLGTNGTSNGLGIRAYRSIGGGADQLVYAASQYAGAIGTAHDLCLYVDAGRYLHARISISFGDTPNTSSSIRYKIYARAHVSGQTAYLGNGGHQPLTFSVFEIAQ